MQNSPHDICYDYYVKFSAEQGQQQPPILKYTPVSIWTCLISTYRPSKALLVDFKDTGFPRVPSQTALPSDCRSEEHCVYSLLVLLFVFLCFKEFQAFPNNQKAFFYFCTQHADKDIRAPFLFFYIKLAKTNKLLLLWHTVM